MWGPNCPFRCRLSCTQNCPKFKLHTLNWNLTQFESRLKPALNWNWPFPGPSGRWSGGEGKRCRGFGQIGLKRTSVVIFKRIFLPGFSKRLDLNLGRVPWYEQSLERRERDEEVSIRLASRGHKYIQAYFWLKPISLPDFSQKLALAKQLNLKRRGGDAEVSVR